MASAPPDKTPKPGVNIYGCTAVNPYKLTIAAEELGVSYNYINVDMGTNEQKSEWFTAINPNGRLPALVHLKEDNTSVSIFESGACLLYLTSEFDKENKLSYPVGTQEYWTQLSWLAWQIASFGPMMAQACHFNRYPSEPQPYGVWRYNSECRRLHHVLNEQLSKQPFVSGDRLTVADIAIFIFAHSDAWVGVNINEFPHVKAWVDKLLQRPAFQKGLQVPVPYGFSDEVVKDPKNAERYQAQRKMGGKALKQATDEWKGDPVPLPSDHANFD